MYRKLWLVILTLTCAVGGAWAGTVSHTVTTGPTTNDWATTISVPRFDTTLGTLTQINFSLTVTASGTLTVHNTDPVRKHGCDISFDAEVTLGRPNGTTILLCSPHWSGNVNQVNENSDFTFTIPAYSATTGTTTPPPTSDLGLFSGAGSIALPIRSRNLATLIGPWAGMFTYSADMQTSVSLTVTYIYAPPWYDPPVDVRCYLAPPTGAPGALTLADITYKRSNILERFVCPLCGYSVGVPRNCPDLWGIHPAQNPAMVDMEQSNYRITGIPDWAMPAAASDLVWHNRATGTSFYRAVIGLPFHPAVETFPGSGVLINNPSDPRSYRWQVHVRVALQQPVDVDNDGDTAGPQDIHSDAQLMVVFLPPGAAFPTGDPAAVSGAVAIPPGGGSPASGVFDPGTPYTIPPDSFGVGRVFLRWRNNPGDPASAWRWSADPSVGAPTGPPVIWGTYFVSRVQVPWTQDTWRQGQAEQATFSGGDYQSGSFLARVLVGPLVGGMRDDLFMPGATTPRRNFTIINRATNRRASLDNLQGALLQPLVAPPGVTSAGRNDLRPVIPDSAVRMGPTGANLGQVPASAIDPSHWVQVSLPSFQPSSEGGDLLSHVPANNWGYRGLAAVYEDLWPLDTAHTNPRTNNGVWDYQISASLNDGGDGTADLIEEFCPFDLQISVDKTTGLQAPAGTAEPGRVAPGTPSLLPDTTVAASGGVPPGRLAFPSNLSLNSPFTVANTGNVVVPPVLIAANQSLALPVEAGNRMRSLARLLGANPVWMPVAPYTTLAASLLPGLSGEAAGWGTVGATAQGNANAPLPLGQALGQYSGQVVYFQDVNGSGALDFVNGQTGAVTNTGVTNFDPNRDEPLEPVASVPTSLRVVETRLPFNDYYAADTEPVIRFDYDPATGVPTNLQFIWVSNRTGLALGSNINEVAPAAVDSAGAAQPSYPGNLVFGNAGLVQAGDYRSWLWGAPAPYDQYNAYALTNTTAAASPGAVNSTPMTFNDLSTPPRHWVFWHRSVPRAGGLESTLRWKGSDVPGWPGTDAAIYAPGVIQQGIRGFADPAGNGVWLFWAEGAEGHQTLHYRWNFTGAADAKEGLLPVTNAVNPDQRSDLITDFASGEAIRKPPVGPFVYVKDPSAFLWTHAGLPNQVHVVFSGFLSRQQNEDLCWAAFDQASMQDGSKNWGKLTFPRVVNNPVLPYTNATGTARAGEQLEGSGLRQTFNSRHLDWFVSSTYGTTNSADDPHLYLGLFFSGAPTTPRLYDVTFAGAPTYSRARGVYTGTPVFTPIAGSPALPWTSPVNPQVGGGPVTLQLEPASGTVTFSAPLFNTANPSDPGAVFNRNLAGLGTLTNLVLFADYTPFLHRITTSDANDDCPNAFAEADSADPNQLRLVFLWRRAYSQKDTPHFGRTGFMYKTWTLGTQVGQPPFVGGTPTVAAWNGTSFTDLVQDTDYTINAASGLVSMIPDGNYAATSRGVFWLRSTAEGARIRITYTGPNGGRVEEHRVIGWSREVPVPVDTVQNEGPLRAAAERYAVSNGLGGSMSVWRYWLTWASPRGIYDLRLPAPLNAGSVVQQSSDVYCATLMPAYGQALREQEVDWQNVQ